jgi:hypothetical protein
MPWGEQTIVDDVAFRAQMKEALRDDISDKLVATSLDQREKI